MSDTHITLPRTQQAAEEVINDSSSTYVHYEMPSRVAKQAHLHWGSVDRPCFCRPKLVLNLDKLQATPETLAALFGVVDPSTVRVQAFGGAEDIPFVSKGSEDYEYWPLETDQHYQVTVIQDSTQEGNDDDAPDVVPIKDIFALLPGDTEAEKSDRLLALSNNFYDKIWHDPTVPEAFFQKFHFVLSSARIQAFRQYDWLFEVFGGPAFSGEPSREDHLVAKVLAKHTSGRMTLEHSVTWLQLMALSAQEEFADLPTLRHALGLYWLHFYGFFPHNEAERRELRRIVLRGQAG